MIITILYVTALTNDRLVVLLFINDQSASSLSHTVEVFILALNNVEHGDDSTSIYPTEQVAHDIAECR